MGWSYHAGRGGVSTPALVVAVVAVFALTGCGLRDVGADQADQAVAKPEQVALRSAATAVRGARTLRASFEFTQSGGTIDGGTISGTADVVADDGMSVSYSYQSAGPNAKKVKGSLVLAEERAFIRSSQWRPPAGKKWLAISPNARAKLDTSIPPDLFALAMAKLTDPMLLLNQGLPELTDLTSEPGLVDGVTTTRYTAQWLFDLDKPGPRVALWAGQIHASVLDIDLHVAADGRPVRMTASSSTTVLQFEGTVSFTDYGADVTVAAPPSAEVGTP